MLKFENRSFSESSSYDSIINCLIKISIFQHLSNDHGYAILLKEDLIDFCIERHFSFNEILQNIQTMQRIKTSFSYPHWKI